MENPGGDGAQDLGSQHEQFGVYRGVGGMDAYCGNLPSSSAACVPGLLRLSQATPVSGVPVPTYSEMHSAEPQSIHIGDVQSLHHSQQHHELEQHSDAMRKAHASSSFTDTRHSEIATSDEDGSISGKFTVPHSLSSPSEGQPGMGVSPPTGKKTKGRVKIKMEYIDNKLRRYTTFSKRKTGIMKKAYELSTLTGTQVMLLVASETGHVYTFATRKLQPMITSEAGKALIQTCLNSPDPAGAPGSGDQRMSATGFEETELCCGAEDEQKEDGDSDCDSSPAAGAAEPAPGVSRPEAVPSAAAAGVSTAAPSAATASIDWSSPVVSAGHHPLPEGLLLLNSPTSVIRRVATELAGEPPCASEPTDLSKSRVTLIDAPAAGPPGRS